MDGFDDPTDLLSIVSATLMILLNAHNILIVTSVPVEASTLEEFNVYMEEGVRHINNIYSTSITALCFFQLWNNLLLGDYELGYWVKSRSTTCFFRFVIEKYV